MKTLTLSLAAILLAGAVPCTVHADSLPSANYSSSQLKTMIREAHTQQQYQALADYFHARQQQFEQQAAAEKVVLDSLSQNIGGPAAKYPRPVDSSRNRYEYLMEKANQMSAQAGHFAALAASRP